MVNQMNQTNIEISSSSLLNGLKTAYYNLKLFTYRSDPCTKCPFSEIRQHISDLQEILIDIIYFEELCLLISKSLKITIIFDFKLLISEIELLHTRLVRNDCGYKLKSNSRCPIKKKRIAENLQAEVTNTIEKIKKQDVNWNYDVKECVLNLKLVEYKQENEFENFQNILDQLENELEKTNEEITNLITADKLGNNIETSKINDLMKISKEAFAERDLNESKCESLPIYFLETPLITPETLHLQHLIIKYKEFLNKKNPFGFLDQSFLYNRHILSLNMHLESKKNRIKNLRKHFEIILDDLAQKICKIIKNNNIVFQKYGIFYESFLKNLKKQLSRYNKIPDLDIKYPNKLKYIIKFKNMNNDNPFVKFRRSPYLIYTLKNHIDYLRSKLNIEFLIGDQVDVFIVNFQFPYFLNAMFKNFDSINQTDYQKLMASDSLIESLNAKYEENKTLMSRLERRYDMMAIIAWIIIIVLIISICFCICFACRKNKRK